MRIRLDKYKTFNAYLLV